MEVYLYTYVKCFHVAFKQLGCMVWKAHGLSQKRNACLTCSILSANSFKIVSLGMYIAILLFFPCLKSTVEVIFINAAIAFGYQTLLQNVIPSVSFSVWETKQNHRGLSPTSREDEE
jgi:hypothetical protein